MRIRTAGTSPTEPRRDPGRGIIRPLAAIVLAAGMAVGACSSGGSPSAEPEPIGDAMSVSDDAPAALRGRSDGPDHRVADVRGGRAPDLDPATPEDPAEDHADGVRAPGDLRELRRLVDAVLLRYGRALTALSVDPERLVQPGTAERRAWDATVLEGSWVSADMLASLVRRQREDHMVVVPDQGELSYRHRPLLVDPPRGGAVSFTWCGWSPGLGVHVATGEVLDEQVAHAHGTGQLRSTRDGWRIESLDQLDLEVLAPGSPDPCPAEVAAVDRPSKDPQR